MEEMLLSQIDTVMEGVPGTRIYKHSAYTVQLSYKVTHVSRGIPCHTRVACEVCASFMPIN